MRRRLSSKCLLCLGTCKDDGKTEGLSSEMVIVGAGKCHLLRRQLEKVFILRKILDIPETWLEETLLEGEGTGGGPADWFVVCGKCLEERVAPAWKIYQQILALEVKLLEVKEGIRGKMKEELIRNKGLLGDGGGVEGKIRRFIFPDLVKIKNEMDENTAEVDMVHSDNDWVDDIVEVDNDNSTTSDFPFDLFNEKRQPGRPNRKKAKNPKEFHVKKKKKWISKNLWHCCREPNCRSRFRTPALLASHIEAHQALQENGDASGETLICPHCPFPAQSPTQLELHLETRHRNLIRMYHLNCPQCDFKVSGDFPTLKTHYDQTHPISPGENHPPSSNPILCSDCPRRCENLKSFVKHQREMHPARVGIPVEPVECSQCGLKFSTSYQLRCHQNRKHGPEKPADVVCDECGQAFRFQSQLQHHKIIHEGKWKRDYVCHLCGLDYAYKWILEKHYRKCHPTPPPGGKVEEPTSSEQPGKEFKCRYCQQTFPIKGILLRHLRTHKEEQGYKCNQCDRFYVNEAGLRRHVKINHPLVKENVPCPHCLKTFASVDYMKDHVRVFCKMKMLGDLPPPPPEITTSAASTSETQDMKPSTNNWQL